MTDVDKQVTDIRRITLKSNFKDQGGNPITELPPGATLDCTSSNPQVCSPLPDPGGVNFSGDTGELGETTFTVTPGGTWDQSVMGPAFAPRTADLTVIASEPAGFGLTIDDTDEVIEAPPIQPVP